MTIYTDDHITEWMGCAVYLPTKIAHGIEESSGMGFVVRFLGSGITNILAIALEVFATMAHLTSAAARHIQAYWVKGNDPDQAAEHREFARQHLRFASMIFELPLIHVYSLFWPPALGEYCNREDVQAYVRPQFYPQI